MTAWSGVPVRVRLSDGLGLTRPPIEDGIGSLGQRVRVLRVADQGIIEGLNRE